MLRYPFTKRCQSSTGSTLRYASMWALISSTVHTLELGIDDTIAAVSAFHLSVLRLLV
jgi:hypothetical protein